MANHGAINDPEIFTKEKREREFQERARAMHERIKEKNSSLFTVEELERLLDLPSWTLENREFLYTQEDVDWMEKLEIKVLS